MRKKYLLTIIILFSILFSAIAGYKGRVYLDENRNGKYDQGENGISGVLVSNGKDVIVSDKNGEFSLPNYKKARFVFISVPSGYKSSGDFFKRLENTVDFNFGLVKYKRTEKQAKFIQITDTETYQYDDWINNIRDYALNNNVGFMVHTGDICYEKGLAFHAKTINTNTMGLPVFYCIGNHDLVKGDYGEQLFESLFGPVYYSFNAGNTHFVVTPMKHGDYKPSYTNGQVYNWLVNDLAHVDASMNLVVFNHNLLTFGEQFIFKGKKEKGINLNEHNLKAWIYGHWHINFAKQHGKNGPVSVCASPPDKGGIDHSASNFVVFDVSKEGKVNITPRYSYVNKHLIINSPFGDTVKTDNPGKLLVSVNTYHSISATKTVAATLVSENDEKISVKLVQNTDWSWSVKVPLEKTIAGTKWQLIVVATFENGETVSRKSNFILSDDTEESDILCLNWLTNIKSNIWMSKPLVADNRVFVASIDDFGMKNCGITALDAENGEQLWYFNTKGSVKNTICYAEGKVLATDIFGISYALNEKSGELIWKKDLGQKALGAYNTGSVVEQGIFYTGFGNYLQAIEIKTGKTIWTNNAWSGGEGAASTMIVAGDVLLAASNWRALYGHDKKTGKLLWKKREDGYRSRSSSATYLNDTLYVASKAGIGLMDAESGKMYKYFKLQYSLLAATKPLLTDKLIIMGTAKKGLLAVDRKTGDEVWRVETGESLFYSSPYSKPESKTVETGPVLINGIIVFGASDGFLYMINPETGEIKHKFDLGAPVFAAVTPTKDGFFVNDFAGNIYSFGIL